MPMAGLDGITRKIDPGEAVDKNLNDLPPVELKEIRRCVAAFGEALQKTLDRNREFLSKGGVFTDDMINAYIELRMAEVARFAR